MAQEFMEATLNRDGEGGLDTVGPIEKRRGVLRKLKELKHLLQEKSNEKDRLHRIGMSVRGEERSELFKQAALYAKEIAKIRRKINKMARYLRALS